MGTLQQRFVEATRDLGKDDAEIAREAKVSRGAISYIRTGATKALKGKNAIALSSVLNVRVEWLVSGTPPMREPENKLGKASDPLWAKDMNEEQVKLTVLVMDHAQHFTKSQTQALTTMLESFIRENEPSRAKVKKAKI